MRPPQKTTTTQEIRLLRQLADAGMHEAAIARALGRTASWVYRWARRNGIRVQRLPKRKPPPKVERPLPHPSAVETARFRLLRIMRQVAPSPPAQPNDKRAHQP